MSGLAFEPDDEGSGRQQRELVETGGEVAQIVGVGIEDAAKECARDRKTPGGRNSRFSSPMSSQARVSGAKRSAQPCCRTIEEKSPFSTIDEAARTRPAP